MKEMMNRVQSFVTFDSPLEIARISGQFASKHHFYQQQFPYWSFYSTRRKIISEFWLRQVLYHFAAILGTAILIVLSIKGLHLFIQSIFLAGGLSFVVLAVTNYWPTFYSDFLPKLDMIINEKEVEIEIAGEIKKCKRTQFSIPSLVVIFYIFSKMSNYNLPASNDNSSAL